MAATTIDLPEFSLVVLIGVSGSGKSTFARRHFAPTEVVNSDFCRALVADDENDQTANKDAFGILHSIVDRRLARRRLTVVDATNVQEEGRRALLEIARRRHCMVTAIVFKLPLSICEARNAVRADRRLGPHVIRRQAQDMRRGLSHLKREGFRTVVVLHTEEEVEEICLTRTPLWTDRRVDSGPFDIIGDVHGCLDELCDLLSELGYSTGTGGGAYAHPDGRRALFLGDLVDRGPDSAGVLRTVMDMADAGTALCVPGNHDERLLRKLNGRDVKLTHGLAETLEQLTREAPEFQERVRGFLSSLVSHFILDGGRLVVAHGGLPEEMQGGASGAIRSFCLYGMPTGDRDEFGLPVRYPWAEEYRGSAMVVYGHTPTGSLEWLNGTINIDTGCAFGGRLTALRYPERELVSVTARREYSVSPRPLVREPERTRQQEQDDLLDLQDVLGRRRIETRLAGAVTIREENAIAALEVMARFAVDPRWLIYLPPTMSPCATSDEPGLLEHPDQALDYYHEAGCHELVLERKHMGSRAVIVLARSAEAARRRFGVAGETPGCCYTRTGRPFFSDPDWENAILERMRSACDSAGLWDELESDWLCWDAEILPWSAKAQSLLTEQYGPTAAAAVSSLGAAERMLALAATRGVPAEPELQRAQERLRLAGAFRDAYRTYCREVTGPDDVLVAPFHLLAGEGQVFIDRPHAWHLECCKRVSQSTGVVETPHKFVDTRDAEQRQSAIEWWTAGTQAGAEGAVVKPAAFLARNERGLLQPALKVRGSEYLRIIYGPEYTLPEYLERLRARGLGLKRSLAIREFGLGVEALERFARREPLRRVHECVFAILALESEPVDPRL